MAYFTLSGRDRSIKIPNTRTHLEFAMILAYFQHFDVLMVMIALPIDYIGKTNIYKVTQ